MSVKIDILNYENYVMDYFDGTLSPADAEAFQAFLMLHPEIAFELEELREIDVRLPLIQSKVDASAFMIPVKNVGAINQANYEMAMALEPNSVGVKAFVAANPKLQKDQKLYAASILQANRAIIFNAKAETKMPVALWETTKANAWRAAAAIVVLMGIVGLLRTEKELYHPRNGAHEFSSLDFIRINRDVDRLNSSREDSSIDTKVVSNSRAAIEESLPALPIATLAQKWQPSPVIYRESPSLFGAISEPIESSLTAKAAEAHATELTVGQLIGKELLGVNPNDAPTVKALLSQGAKKMIERSDRFALESKETLNNRKVFRLTTGALEFKRITYTTSN